MTLNLEEHKQHIADLRDQVREKHSELLRLERQLHGAISFCHSQFPTQPKAKETEAEKVARKAKQLASQRANIAKAQAKAKANRLQRQQAEQ